VNTQPESKASAQPESKANDSTREQSERLNQQSPKGKRFNQRSDSTFPLNQSNIGKRIKKINKNNTF